MARLTVLLLVAASLAACSTSPAMKIDTAHDPAIATQLRSYRTYRVQPVPGQGPVEDVATGPTIVRSVEETLGAKGYRPEASRPDFVVRWDVSIGSGQRTTTMETPVFRDVGPRPSAASSSVPPITRQYREGTLILDVVDAGSDKVVWRGSAQAELTGPSDPGAREARIREAVRRILERFPPQ